MVRRKLRQIWSMALLMFVFMALVTACGGDHSEGGHPLSDRTLQSDADSRSDCHSDTHPDRNSDSNPDGDADSHPNCNSDSDRNRDSDSHADCHSNSSGAHSNFGRSSTAGCGGQGRPVNQKVTATFSEAMDPATIIDSTFTVTGPGLTPVGGSVTYDAASDSAIFTPTGTFAPSTEFTATITTGAQSSADCSTGDKLRVDFHDRRELRHDRSDGDVHKSHRSHIGYRHQSEDHRNLQ